MPTRASPRAAKKKSYAESDDGESDASSDFAEGSGGGAMESSDDDDSMAADSVSSDAAPRKKARKETPTKKSPAKASNPSKSGAKAAPKAKAPPSSGRASAPAPRAATATASAKAQPSQPVASLPVGGALGGLDVAQGPPVSTDSAAKKLLLTYMRQQNRPYSLLQIFDNLHKRIPKATLERVLGVLCAPGEGLSAKEYGKAKVFFVDQASLNSDFTPDQLQDLINENDALKAKLGELSGRARELKGELGRLQGEPEDSQLSRLIEEAEQRLEGKEQKLKTLMGAGGAGKGGSNGNAGALKAAITKHNKTREEWLKRKSMCTDALDLLGETMDKKRSDLMNELGIEGDEEHNVRPPVFLKEPVQNQKK